MSLGTPPCRVISCSKVMDATWLLGSLRTALARYASLAAGSLLL